MLQGLRVVELGVNVRAAYCTKLLADLGADVLKLDLERFPAPRLDTYLNGAKRRGRFEGAVPACDVVVEDLGAGGLEGRDVKVTSSLVRISDFGQHGPHRDVATTDLTLQAMSGWVSVHGVPGRTPLQVGGRIHEFVGGTFAACAALTAWRAARDLGAPVTVDVSMLECLVGTLAYPMLFNETLSALGLPPPESRYSTLPGIVRASDGWVGINCLTGQHWKDVCALLEAEAFNGRQHEVAWGGSPHSEFLAAIRPWLDRHTVEQVVEVAQAFRIPAAPVGDGRSMPEYAQFRARPFFVTDPDGASSEVKPSRPYRFTEPPAASATTAPSESPTHLADGYLPFAGLRVVDLGTFWAGPYVGLYLGALGADVVKVESVQRPDGFRFSGAYPQEGDDWHERSGLWQATNLNKRGITLDLTRPEGIDLLRPLLAAADVVVENFSARVVEQFGLGYEQLCAIRPDVVMMRMPAFGLDGPWRDYVGWAMGIEQASGMAQVTGDADGQPLNPGGFMDPVIGMHALVALQSALERRRRTGQGCMIEVAQVEVGLALTAEQVIAWSTEGTLVSRHGNDSPDVVEQGVYRCVGEPPWIAVSIRDAADTERLETLTGGRPLAAWLEDREVGDAVAALRGAGICAAGLLTAPQMYDEPQLVARGYYQAIDHPVTGTRRYPGWPMQFSFGPPTPHRFGSPTLGQDNCEILGIDDDRAAALTEQNVIGTKLLR